MILGSCVKRLTVKLTMRTCSEDSEKHEVIVQSFASVELWVINLRRNAESESNRSQESGSVNSDENIWDFFLHKNKNRSKKHKQYKYHVFINLPPRLLCAYCTSQKCFVKKSIFFLHFPSITLNTNITVQNNYLLQFCIFINYTSHTEDQNSLLFNHKSCGLFL